MAEDQAEVSRSRRMVQRCMSNKILVALGSIAIIAVVAGICAAIAFTVIAQQNKTAKSQSQKTTSADKSVRIPLNITWQCNTNGSVTLEFPSEVVGKLTMFRQIFYSIQTYGPSGMPMMSNIYRVCDERRVSDSRQLLERDNHYNSSSNVYEVHIFEHGDESGNSIAVRREDLLQHWVRKFNCDKIKSERVSVVGLENTGSLKYVKFDGEFMIGNKSFYPRTLFSNQKLYRHLGDPVKMEIEIRDKNLFGKKSRLESCKLDIPYCHDGHVESISILENFSPTPEGRAIGFQAKYTPEYYDRRHKSSKDAKYTVEFNAFMLRNRKPFNFICQASSD